MAFLGELPLVVLGGRVHALPAHRVHLCLHARDRAAQPAQALRLGTRRRGFSVTGAEIVVDSGPEPLTGGWVGVSAERLSPPSRAFFVA